MSKIDNKKICIVVSSLGKGGAERSSALLSRMLYNLGYVVHIVSVLNEIDYEYNGTLLNLGELKEKNDTIIGKFKRYKFFKNYILNQKFDLIIDSRSRPYSLKEFYFKSYIYKNQNVAFIVHSSKLDVYLPKSKFIFDVIYKSAKGFVCVSDAIKEQIQINYNINNVLTIKNAVDISNNETLSTDNLELNFEYILYYGRLEDKIKNISLLLDSYKISKLPSKGIKLLILGDGSDEIKLKNKVDHLNLNEYIKFQSFVSNPFPYIKNAKFTVLTSRFEGFPMVIPESLSLGVPVISVDCKSGPNEVIKNGYNGLLVENYNEQALAEAMNSFIFDVNLYQTCRENAKKSIEKFSLENISVKWDNLIKMLI